MRMSNRNRSRFFCWRAFTKAEIIFSVCLIFVALIFTTPLAYRYYKKVKRQSHIIKDWEYPDKKN